DRGIPIEEVDAVFGRPLGMPKSGVFGTLDFVGLGLIPHVVQNFVEMLDKNDPFRRLNYHRAVDIVNEMVKDGRTGRQAKGDKGGFYRLEKDDDGKKRAKESVNLLTQEYAVSEKPKLKAAKAGLKGPRAVLETKDKHGAMAWAVMRDTLLYAAALVPEIADRIQDVDAAMRGGFGWEYGPFEMIDKFGVKYEREEGLTGAYNKHAPWKKDVAGISWFVKRAQRDGCVIPPLLQLAKDRFFYKIDENGDKQALDFNFESGYASYQPMRTPRGIVSLDDVKRHSKPLIERESASVWDIGDGVLCCEFHSLKNMIDPCILRVINDTNRMIRESQGLYKGLVFYNDYNYFSPGANLPLIGGKLLWSRNPLNMINDLIVHPNIGVPAYKTLGIPRFASDKLHKGVNKVLNLIEKGFETVSFEYRRKAGNDYITDIVYQGQAVLDALHKAPFPSVAALHRFCLGGAYEIAANCSAIQAHAETNAGLPEMGVGLKPGWTGHIRLLERIMDSPELAGEDIYQPVSKTFLNVMAPVMSISMSAADAFMKYWMRPDKDGITMNRSRLLTDAKARVLELADGYDPPKPRTFNLPGKTAWASLQTGADAFYLKGLATWYDLEIADAVGDTVTGGDTHRGISIHQNDMYHREFENFRSLLENDHTLKRILHMVATNKPLREDEGPGRGITPHEIRRLRMPVTLPKRPFTGEPLEGEEESRLKAYARHSSVFRWAVKKAGLG
ncbi:MAG: hypothetical protein HY370_03180, partial [Proteobacteria bacterium]|nr:hypothetical protein [Pseudomonadota bacterium]